MAASTRTTRVTFPDEYLNWRRCRTAVESDGGDNAGVILWLSKLIANDRWTTLRREDGSSFETFTEFVRDQPKGLGMEPDDLLLLIQVRGVCERDGRWDAELFASVRADVARLLGVPTPVLLTDPATAAELIHAAWSEEQVAALVRDLTGAGIAPV
ncbi:hypothetical protein [Mycobacteroides chelonae]|uniref:hypothetical protein n=1 Tax=Mycobacteroides chelonae TaxID=1774 RepID=UPI0018B0CB5F|nr:hypothetical protein [Mycobacteroides chelonae]MBF9519513.1 hypothetical protein [Mycobacteroides chelonae]